MQPPSPPPLPPHIEQARVFAYTIPTETPESDGTLAWQSTTPVLVELESNGVTGLGYSYANLASAQLIDEMLLPLLRGAPAFAIPAHWQAMRRALRNQGRSGIAAMALSAVDIALWDLKARLLGVSMADLLGTSRPCIAGYGSGGFTSYSLDQLQRHCADWIAMGLHSVKIKVGRHPHEDIDRVRAARAAVGSAALMVDANGGYEAKQALALAEAFAREGVDWFEEPVPMDDLAGLRLLRDRLPPGMALASGEYGYQPDDFRTLLAAGAVDVLQADVTRCGGITGFLSAAALAEAFHIPLSSHCAPALHVPLCCAVRPACHVEVFHDHLRIEMQWFDGFSTLREGMLWPPQGSTGLGLVFRHDRAQPYQVGWR